MLTGFSHLVPIDLFIFFSLFLSCFVLFLSFFLLRKSPSLSSSTSFLFYTTKQKLQTTMDFYGLAPTTPDIRCQFSETSDFLLLGSKFSFSNNDNNNDNNDQQTPQQLRETLRSLLWMSYRSGWTQPISGLTTDAGWGCMYRSAQMMFANLLLKHISPSCSSPPSTSPFTSSLPSPSRDHYQQIAQLFVDNDSSPYSMHKLVPLAEMILNRKSGEWIAPSEAIQVLAIALQNHPNEYHPRLFPYMVRDSIMYLNDVVEMSVEYGGGEFCPVMVSVPVRLGLEKLNEDYEESLKKVFSLPQHVGIIGGQPRSSFFFIGIQDNNLFYLDPHTVQPTPSCTLPPPPTTPPHATGEGGERGGEGGGEEGGKGLEEREMESFFPKSVGVISMGMIDPSMALCFYCPTLESLEELGERVREDEGLKKLFWVDSGRGEGEEEEEGLCEFEMDDFMGKGGKETVVIGDGDDEFVLM